MIVHKTRNIYARHSGVSLLEIYSSISEAFHSAYAGKTETPDVEVGPALGRVLPVPGDLGHWLVLE